MFKDNTWLKDLSRNLAKPIKCLTTLALVYSLLQPTIAYDKDINKSNIEKNIENVIKEDIKKFQIIYHSSGEGPPHYGGKVIYSVKPPYALLELNNNLKNFTFYDAGNDGLFNTEEDCIAQDSIKFCGESLNKNKISIVDEKGITNEIYFSNIKKLIIGSHIDYLLERITYPENPYIEFILEDKEKNTLFFDDKKYNFYVIDSNKDNIIDSFMVNIITKNSILGDNIISLFDDYSNDTRNITDNLFDKIKNLRNANQQNKNLDKDKLIFFDKYCDTLVLYANKEIYEKSSKIFETIKNGKENYSKLGISYIYFSDKEGEDGEKYGGRFKSKHNSILIFKSALSNTGTLYHEFGHSIYQIFFVSNQKILNQWIVLYNDLKAKKLLSSNYAYTNASEGFAEEYEFYKLNKNPKQPQQVKEIFEFIDELLQGGCEQ